MKLQLALDDISLADALRLVEQIRDCLDIVEIGTPLIIEEGLAPVRAFKARFPDLEVLATLAEGGMGRVLLAWQRSLGRDGVQQALERVGELDLGGFRVRYAENSHRGSSLVLIR